MEVTDFDPVECPVADCEYSDRIRSVAGHVSESDDGRHSWSRLGYDGARDFVMTEKRRQRGDGESSGASETSAGSATPSRDSATPSRDSARASGAARDSTDDDREPFDLGIERDALVLLSLADEYDFETLDDLDTSQLVDLYSLLSDLKSSAEDARKEVRDALIDATGEEGQLTADLGSVSRYSYERRSLKDDAAVRTAVRDAGVDPVSVRSFDSKKLREAAEDGLLDEEAVFDFEERTQIRKGKTNENGRWERFQRLPEELRSFAEDD
ncbi:hypothetical protein NGM10_07000 [Halorussus salilacus]|uniref:hypothetical protein n=1 Tax=Halorussus salilacus TaxID=2953750 RepID=UPI00209F3978|nr:hypothetical protein [Halorussus salilacus]USZ69475.1 hypothetical protein NGM10_07000 [Halorussus salilacus]